MLHLKHPVLFFTLKQIGKNCRQQKKERTKQIGNQLAGSLFQSVQILIFDWFFLDKVYHLLAMIGCFGAFFISLCKNTGQLGERIFHSIQAQVAKPCHCQKDETNQIKNRLGHLVNLHGICIAIPQTCHQQADNQSRKRLVNGRSNHKWFIDLEKFFHLLKILSAKRIVLTA